ncbi:MAG: NADH-quinone oxidoreductase subunit L [Verrucomicrobia bacterium]|jgi:NADH-quinone oxidoreductase subunit L|nr:NADH-quinone oxidoreductase subunit L [Verrucomicrobiota bacterium]
MTWIARNLWLIPALPLVASGLTALMSRRRRGWAAALAIGSLGISFLLALCAFAAALGQGGEHGPFREVVNFDWFQFGGQWLQLGWVLDPLTALMVVMVTLVGLLIFIFSVGYMAEDENFTRFFCFLSLFAAAMLGVVIANSLLLFFICWELVGLTSYLLIGFWYHKPSAAAAAKKAFITTRIGDLGLLLGMVWLYAESGTLLFYNGGAGCLEQGALTAMLVKGTAAGMAVSTGIGLLVFLGAVGKSGQVPLHVWLPDAMEGPTPVSALIHAATMVAAGVFLVARVYPLMAVGGGVGQGVPVTTVLTVVTWIGAATALFAASVAVAQNDIKRILAYSTVSQLGYMMMGLGVGGVAVGMFHLITHAFFKALLFLGSGSVIHGCHHEQDVRRMGGLKGFMPVTFVTYAIGMLALAGFPLVFSGFWSKDEILHAAHGWSVSHWPFYMGLAGAFLTAFYMTRQVALVFFGKYRGAEQAGGQGREQGSAGEAAHTHHSSTPSLHHSSFAPHESPSVMTGPLMVLAVFAVALGWFGTPAWPWFEAFLNGHSAEVELGKLFSGGFLGLALLSTLIVFAGLGLGWWLYGRRTRAGAEEPDVMEQARPDLWALLKNKFFVDELYEATVIRGNAWVSRACHLADRWVLGGAVQLIAWLATGVAWVDRVVDEFVINLGFDGGCRGLRESGGFFARLQQGRVQPYLRALGWGVVVLVIVLMVWRD